jgi:antibiotic biosynthesis monooxygenase (ABM) superfamily enzyme
MFTAGFSVIGLSNWFDKPAPTTVGNWIFGMLNPLIAAFYVVLAVLGCTAEAELGKTYTKWKVLQANIAEEEATAM